VCLLIIDPLTAYLGDVDPNTPRTSRAGPFSHGNQADPSTRVERKRGSQGERQRASRARRERIQFLIAFAETDPGALVSPESPGDLLNLAARLYRFGFIVPKTNDLRTEIQRLAETLRAKPRLLQPMVGAIRKLLAAAADKTHFEWV
jgi:hypothetical protein